MSSSEPEQTQVFRAARDQLVRFQQDYEQAREQFEWPRFEEFNFALDWFDRIAASPERADQDALIIAEADGSVLRRSFAELSETSGRVANWLREQGMRRGDRMILMLGNQIELWELMLAGIKLGAVLIPTAVQMGPADLQDRATRGQAVWAAAGPEDLQKFSEVSGKLNLIHVPGFYTPQTPDPEISGHLVLHYPQAYRAASGFTPDAPTAADETLLLYFTSGTTSLPKLVEHTHTSYPVGHLTTMYWIGIQPGDVHLNVAGPGWGKHAWSNFFAPWIAEATIFVYNYQRFDAYSLMDRMQAHGVTSFCAPPTVWRMLIQADLSRLSTPPRVTVSAGEPLNAEVIEQVRRVWGTTIRDGFGQTESTLQVANTPGLPVTPGSMGRPLPGFDVMLLDPQTDQEAPALEGSQEGELCLRAEQTGPNRPVGLLKSYYGDEQRTAEVFRGGVYHSGDVVRRNAEGVLTYVGRSDDVFKASDYRISPFELESVLVEHPAVVEAAVIPSPDPLRLAVPKAFVVLAAGVEWDERTAAAILRHCREAVPPFKRIRRIELADLPKTISGKIRRVELRELEESRPEAATTPAPLEFREADLELSH